MNIKELSDRDILCLQYSILEELKTIKNPETYPIITDNADIDIVLSNSIKEKKTLSTSVRITPFSQQKIENSKYSYSDAIEYFTHAILSNNFENNKICPVDNVTPQITRSCPEYDMFRENVLNRDNICQCCGSNEDLVVHHLFSFNDYNSLGADNKNGIVLCKKCHNKYHSQYGTKKHNNPVTFSQFLRDYGKIMGYGNEVGEEL